jgi:tripartite-type tricarboxylate transporter receptor subunit TctC
VPYYGFFAPAGTPQPAVDAFAAALGKVIASAELRERLTGLGFTVGFMSQQQLAERERAYARTWARIVRDSGFQPQ